MTVARSKRSLSRFAALVRATCSDGQRDWTQFVLPRSSKSFAIKRGRIVKRISFGPAGSPAVGHLSVTARFGRTGSSAGRCLARGATATARRAAVGASRFGCAVDATRLHAS